MRFDVPTAAQRRLTGSDVLRWMGDNTGNSVSQRSGRSALRYFMSRGDADR
jgi:hypothetical protein